MKLLVALGGLVLLASCGLVTGQNDDTNLDNLLAELFSTPNPNGNTAPTPVQPATSRPITPIQPASNVNPTSRPVQPVNPGPIQPQVNPNGNNLNAQFCDGECVPYYLCSNNSIITDGAGLIDIRIDDGNSSPRQCQDYFETCCALEDKLPTPVLPPIHQSSGCGNRNRNGVGFRISGDSDSEAEFGEFPWMVAVLKEERALPQVLNAYQCGGSLIHENVVLTAAHCVAGKDPELLKIRAGEWDTQTKNEPYEHQDREVASMVLHPQYSKGNLVNDVALLFLRQPVTLGNQISTVCLPPQDFNFDRSRCLASGWGKDVFGKEGKYQVILKKIELPMVNNQACQNSLRSTRLGNRFILSNTFVCAGGELGKDTCKGDGGSPLVCPTTSNGNRYYQSGIVAWGIGCGENQVPGVYVNVAKFRNWIDQQMRQRNYNTASYTA